MQPRARLGRSFFWGIGLCIATLFLPRVGLGHTPGLSMAELDVDPGGRVDARFTFATAEPLGDTPMRDENLREFLMDGVEVTADGERCDATYRGASVAETDALVLEATYACPGDAGEIAVTLYYLNKLRPGHREIARITAKGASAEALLTSDRRALSLKLPGGGGRRARLERRLVGLAAAFAVFMISLFVWRWRATRKRAPVRSS